MSQESGGAIPGKWHSCIVEWVSLNVKRSVSRFAFYFANPKHEFQKSCHKLHE